MKNKTVNLVAVLAVLAILVSPAAVFAQEVPPDHGAVEFGVRGISGEVDGRPDLGVRPSLFTSKMNEYRDLKNGVFVRRLDGTIDVGTNSFLSVQSRSSILSDQSWLAKGGRYGKYNVQFLYEETPHVFTNTGRMLYVPASNGVYQLSPAVRTQLFNAANINPSLLNTVTNPAYPSAQAAVLNPALFNATNALIPSATWISPNLVRKAGTGAFAFNFTPDWSFAFLFGRERETGTRPLGFAIGSGGAEVPEPIDYTMNKFKLGTEFAQSRWGLQVGWEASQFNNEIGSVAVVNPYSPAPNSTVYVGQVVAGTGLCASGATAPACVPVTTTANGDLPATKVTIAGKTYTVSSVTGMGRMSLYPDNFAQNASFAGRFDLTRSIHVAASIVPGWMSQNSPFQPYTTNLTNGAPPALPESSLHGSKQTLAMNYVISTKVFRKIDITAKYRSYDYNNNTPVQTFYTSFAQDGAVPANLNPATCNCTAENDPFGFNRKTAELAATYALGKKSSAKIGYEYELMERQHRDVSSTEQNSLIASVDSNLRKDLSLRLAYRHADRSAQGFQYDPGDPNYAWANSSLILQNGTRVVASSRRFDEAPRLEDRGDVLLQYSPLDRLSFSGFWGTVQDNYNRRLGNQVPFGVIAGSPFYSYGLLKDLSTTYGFDGTYAVSKDLVIFGEYTRERYFTRMVSEQFSGTNTNTLNDWTSQNRNLVDTWATGVDASVSKKISVSTFYSLSAATGNTSQSGVNCVVGTVACRANSSWLLDGPVYNSAGTLISGSTSPLYFGGGPNSSTYGLNFPEAVSRMHQVVAQVRFKLTNNLIPKFEYRFEKFDDLNYQTASNPQLTNPLAGGLNPYMYGGLAIDPNSVTGTNKYLFLGADTPSYHAHIFAATLEYRF